jgi:hypothetical protein
MGGFSQMGMAPTIFAHIDAARGAVRPTTEIRSTPTLIADPLLPYAPYGVTRVGGRRSKRVAIETIARRTRPVEGQRVPG